MAEMKLALTNPKNITALLKGAQSSTLQLAMSKHLEKTWKAKSGQTTSPPLRFVATKKVILGDTSQTPLLVVSPKPEIVKAWTAALQDAGLDVAHGSCVLHVDPETAATTIMVTKVSGTSLDTATKILATACTKIPQLKKKKYQVGTAADDGDATDKVAARAKLIDEIEDYIAEQPDLAEAIAGLQPQEFERLLAEMFAERT